MIKGLGSLTGDTRVASGPVDVLPQERQRDTRNNIVNGGNQPVIDNARDTIIEGNTDSNVLGGSSGAQQSDPIRGLEVTGDTRTLGMPQWEGLELERSEAILSSDINVNLDTENFIRGIQVGDEVSLGLFDLSGDGITAEKTWKFAEQANRVQDYFSSGGLGEISEIQAATKIINLQYLIELLKKSDGFFDAMKNPWSPTVQLPTRDLFIDLSYTRRSDSSIFRNSNDFLKSFTDDLSNPAKTWNEYSDFLYILFIWGSKKSLKFNNTSDINNLLNSILSIQSESTIKFPKNLESWNKFRNSEERASASNMSEEQRIFLKPWNDSSLISLTRNNSGYFQLVKEAISGNVDSTVRGYQAGLDLESSRFYLFFNSILRNSKLLKSSSRTVLSNDIKSKIREARTKNLIEGFPANIIGSPFSPIVPESSIKLCPLVNINSSLINLFSSSEDQGREEFIETGLNEKISPEEIINWTSSLEKRLKTISNVSVMASKEFSESKLYEVISNTIEEHVKNLYSSTENLKHFNLLSENYEQNIENNSLILEQRNLELTQDTLQILREKWEGSISSWRMNYRSYLEDVTSYNSRVSDFAPPTSTGSFFELKIFIGFASPNESLRLYGVEDAISIIIENFSEKIEILENSLQVERDRFGERGGSVVQLRNLIYYLNQIKSKSENLNNLLKKVEIRFAEYRDGRLQADIEEESIRNEIEQRTQESERMKSDLLIVQKEILKTKNIILSHWILKKSASKEVLANNLLAATSLASFHEWSGARNVLPDSQQIEFMDIFESSLIENINISAENFSSNTNYKKISFNSSGFFLRAQFNPIKYISDYIVGPIFEKFLLEQASDTILRNPSGDFAEGTLHGGINQFTIWSMILFLVSLEIQRIYRGDNLALVEFTVDDSSEEERFQFYYSEDFIRFFTESYENNNSLKFFSNINNTEFGYFDTIPMFHTHIRNNVIVSSRLFTQRIEEAAAIENTENLDLSRIQTRAQTLRTIWDKVGNLKLLRSRTQLLHSMWEANIEKESKRNPSPRAYDQTTEERAPSRVYLKMLDFLLSNFEFHRTTLGVNSRNGDKIVITGSPIRSGFWERSPINQISLNYNSLLNPLNFNYEYTVDQGIWAYPNDADYRYKILPKRNLARVFFGAPRDIPDLNTIADFAGRYWTFYRFEDGAIRKLNYEEAVNYYKTLGYQPATAEKIINTLLLSEHMKIWLDETMGINLKDTDFSSNRFTELSFSDKRIISPYDRRPFDRLYCLPWSIDLLFSLRGFSRDMTGAAEDSALSVAEYIYFTSNSEFLIGELSVNWLTPSYNGASNWSSERR